MLVAIGGGVTTAAVAGARRADTAFDRFLDQARSPIQVTLAGRGDPESLDGVWDQLPTRFAQIPGVQGAVPMAWMAVALQTSDGEPGFYFSPAIGAGAGASPPIGSIVVAGRAADPSNAHEVVINEFAAASFGVELDDVVELRTYSIDQLSDFFSGDGAPDRGPRIDVEIVGIVRSPEDVAFAGEPIVFLTGAFRDRYRDRVVSCDCAVLVNAEANDIDTVLPALESSLGDFPMVVEEYDSQSKRLVARAVGLEVGALWIAAIVAAVAALLVVSQALARHVGGSRRSSAALSAVGATRGDVLGGWVVVLTPVALLGAVGAGAVAIALSPLFPRGLARRAEPQPGVRIDAVVIAGGVVATTLIVLATTATIAYTQLRSIDGRRTVVATGRPAARALALPPTTTLGLSLATNPGRERSRVSALTAVLGLSIAIATALAVAMVERSTSEVLRTPSAFGADWDFELIDAPSDPEATIAATMQEPIEALATLHSVSGTDFSVSGPGGLGLAQPFSFDQLVGSIGPFIARGRVATAADEVVLGPKFAQRIGADVGDEITFQPGSVSFQVSGIGLMSDGDETDNSVVMTVEGTLRLSGGEPSDTSGAYLRLGQSDQTVRDRLANLGWTPATPPSKVQNLDQIGTVPRLLAIALAVLGLAGAIHAMLVAMSQRSGDIAVVRALGFTPGQASRAVTWQAVATACAGIVVGIPAGLLAGRMIWKQVAEGVGAADLVSIAWLQLVAVPIAAMCVLAVAGMLVGRRAARLDPARVLRSE